MKDKIPFVAIGNEEIRDNPSVGEFATCPSCAKKHKVEYGTNTETGEVSKTIGFVKCGENSYMISLAGKLLTPTQ